MSPSSHEKQEIILFFDLTFLGRSSSHGNFFWSVQASPTPPTGLLFYYNLTDFEEFTIVCLVFSLLAFLLFMEAMISLQYL